MAFDCVRGQGPGYFDDVLFYDVLVPVHSVGARARLQSADHGDHLSVWNDLASELKNSYISMQGFKSGLKSWLFEDAYS